LGVVVAALSEDLLGAVEQLKVDERLVRPLVAS